MIITRFRSLALVLGVLIAMLGTTTALAYTFPSTNDNNRTLNRPHVNLVSTGAGQVTLQFVNTTNSLAYFEFRVDDWGPTSGIPHPVIAGEEEYDGVCVIGPTYKPDNPPSGCTRSARNVTFLAYEKVDVRLALGGERDWDFDWVAFEVLPADNDCSFITDETAKTVTLQGDCTTRSTIYVPDGYTLNGDGHTITANDPTSGSFMGAIVQNLGDEANVVNLGVKAEGLKKACHAASPGDLRLRGILLNRASGTIAYNTVTGINQGASGCQEGNAIEVRNPPFDGLGTDPLTVEIAHNTVDDYQKTGIVANGNVDVNIHHNWVGDSATQANLAANGIQLGFGATGSITQNTVYGNQWLQKSDWTATAMLIYDVKSAVVSKNDIRGNADIGIDISSNNVTLDNNRVFDEGQDGGICHTTEVDDEGEEVDCEVYDIGISSYGNSTLTNNKVRGFDTPYAGLTEPGDNKVIGSPSN